MSATSPAALDVYVDVAGQAVQAGTAWLRHRGAKTTTEFTYSTGFLADGRAYDLDPGLPLTGGRTVLDGLPAAFSDSTPDSWGRQLVSKRLRLEASQAGQPAPLVTEVDHLVGVSDRTRQGNLRFAASGTATFLDPDTAVPKLIGLPELLDASDQVVAGRAETTTEALKTLLAAGSATLGGARPKASVEDDGRLLIAKFPHQADEWDVMAWEKTALDLAELAGIEVPCRRLVDVSGRKVLLLDRFDRAPATDPDLASGAVRVGYASARTLAQASSSAGNDYLDLVAAIEDHSAETVRDLRDLWRRVAFTVAVNNTDDHFHNHGFLRAGAGWVLAPVFDINIDPQAAQPRSTTLAGAGDRAESLEALVRESAYFAMSRDEAAEGLSSIAHSLTNWREVARGNDVPDRELDRVGTVIDSYLDAVL